MNTLTTRKIVLGLLMTLVLAFSVPGVVDAQTFPLVGMALRIARTAESSS